MTDMKDVYLRIGSLLYIMENSKSKTVGRTAAMKYQYLLQTVKKVHLGYDFRLYYYGPFSQEVLNDIDYAESLGVLKTEVVYYASGYGYKISPGAAAQGFMEKASEVIAPDKDKLDWLVGEFEGKSAAELELIGTAVYIDRNAGKAEQIISINDICSSIKRIKPRFDLDAIRKTVSELLEKKVFVAVRNNNLAT
ncbi:MAG: hypothetical protein V1816_15370 [Pseudomonadota bacterium]